MKITTIDAEEVRKIKHFVLFSEHFFALPEDGESLG
jgi:hypothetical protein